MTVSDVLTVLIEREFGNGEQTDDHDPIAA
jgi:hypothetical protein